MMKVLFIGGSGNISTETSKLAISMGFDLTLLNRGKTEKNIEGAKYIRADIRDESAMVEILKDKYFDCVVDWIAFPPSDIERDIRLFKGRCGQFIFISSASAYQKPSTNHVITESTPLANPYWQYSRDKIKCEDLLMEAYRNEGFPFTVVRPSHTYDTIIPIAIGGGGEYTAIDRIKKGLPIISHGDGTSLWVLTHSFDFAKAFCGLIGNPHSIGQAYHITSDEVLAWDQIYHTIGDALGVKPNIVHVPSDYLAKMDSMYEGELIGDKACSVVFDNTKIKTLVPSFICTVPFHIGIRKTLSWFEEKKERQIVNVKTNAFIDKVLLSFPH